MLVREWETKGIAGEGMGDKKVLLVREWEIKGIAGEGMGDKRYCW